MARLDQAVEVLREGREPKRDVLSGWLYPASLIENRPDLTTAEVSDKPGYVYVLVDRGDVDETGDIIQAYGRIRPIPGWPVRVGTTRHRPWEYNVLDVDLEAAGGLIDGQPFLEPHHETHEFGHPSGSDDMVASRFVQLYDFGVWPSLGLTTNVADGVFQPTGVKQLLDFSNLNLATWQPASGYQRWVIVCLSPSGTLEVWPGSLIDGYADIDDIPEVGVADWWELAAVRLIGTNTTIIMSPTSPNVVDLRFSRIGWPQYKMGGPSGSHTFLGLEDTPSSYVSQAGRFVRVRAIENGLEFDQLTLDDVADVNVPAPNDADVLMYVAANNRWEAMPGGGGPTGSHTFIGLYDTPSSYVGQADKFVRVRSIENGLEFDQLTLNDVADVNVPTPNDDDVLTYNSVSGLWESAAPSPGPTGTHTFIGLYDTPNSYVGQAKKFPQVGAVENQIVFADANDLLTSIKTVDGPGSGLDADLVDGVEESAFLLASGARAGSAAQAQSFGATGIKTDVIAVSTPGADLVIGQISTVLVSEVPIYNGTVDGVDVSIHASRHGVTGSDPLSTVPVHDHTGDLGDGAKIDHGAALDGLADDDHTQYLLATGARAGSTGQAQDFGATGVKADVVAESTPDAGVTADGVLLKDGLVSGVDVAAHVSRHAVAGADALTNVPNHAHVGVAGDGGVLAAPTAPIQYGGNLIRNSPGQIYAVALDGLLPQWWAAGADAAITTEDAIGEGIPDIATRVFKVVTGNDNRFGYQDLYFADEDTLDAGVTPVSFGCWVWCASASVAKIVIAGTNMTNVLSPFHTGDSTWQWLAAENATLHAADTFVRPRLQVNTGTAWFAMPMFCVGPKARPWRARDILFVPTATYRHLDYLGTTFAWTNLNLLAGTHPLAIMAQARTYVSEPDGTAGSWCSVGHALALAGSSITMIQARSFVVGQPSQQIGMVMCDDAKNIRVRVLEADADADVTAYVDTMGYWRWN